MDILFNLETEDKFKTVVEEIIKNLYNKQNNSTLINQHIITTAKEEIKAFIIKNDFNTEKIHEFLQTQGYNEERVKMFVSIIENRRDELLYLTLIHLNSSYGETVTKFDWMLKLVCGTSELKMLKYPVLQLAMTTVSNENCNLKQYDIRKDMLIKMISELENVNLD